MSRECPRSWQGVGAVGRTVARYSRHVASRPEPNMFDIWILEEPLVPLPLEGELAPLVW